MGRTWVAAGWNRRSQGGGERLWQGTTDGALQTANKRADKKADKRWRLPKLFARQKYG